MPLSPRQPTRAAWVIAQQLPEDADHQVQWALQPISFLVHKYNIPPATVYMADETFVTHRPDSKCEISTASCQTL